MDNKTIYALSTVFGKSGIAVFRISGNKAFDFFDKMTGLKSENIESRKMYYTQILNIDSRETSDKCMVVAFKAPNSFTGENTVEINCHGSKAVIRSIADSLSKIEGFRVAEPGEFSRRAFYNGKMDLTEADGLADLIDAETELQQKVALRQMGGTLFNLYENWRERLVSLLSHVEAYIDFPDEDIPEDTVFKMENDVFKIIEEIEAHLQNNKVNERLRDGFQAVISGPTNAGKSSLINAIVRRNVAIVSDIAGTTRDVIEAYVDIKGFPVVFSDTAGLRESDDTVEKIGIDLARQKIKEADFNIFLFDAENTEPEVFKEYCNTCKNFLLVANKKDKISSERQTELKNKGCVLISAKQNDNIEAVTSALYDCFNNMYSSSSAQLITRQRYKEALIECLDNLKRFNLHKEIELSAEDIRLACRAIGKITGRVEVDEILDKIFSSFCIGK